MAEGLLIASTDAVRSFFLSAAAAVDEGGGLTLELRGTASSLFSRDVVPYRTLRAVWCALPAARRPPLRRLLAGSDFVFCSPKPREKCEELKDRLKKLAEMTERRDYAELVKGIAPSKGKAEPFSSYKDQIGFGIHVVLIMFTGYLVGFAAFRALFNHSPVMNAAGGILGLVCGMLLETILFVVRSSNQEMVPATLKSKKHQQPIG